MGRESIISRFTEVFGNGDGAVRTFFAPGRVNLFGSHAGDSGGQALACALALGTTGAARLRSDRLIRFFSANHCEDGITEFSLDDDLEQGRQDGWVSFVRGVFWIFRMRGTELPCGLEICYESDLPSGAGLSMSGSLEILTVLILKEMYGLEELGRIQMSVLAHRAETEYVGLSCGIMDQMVAALGKKGQAFLLNTARLSYEYVPLKLQGLELVVTDSRVRHRRDEVENFVRRKECEKALKKLQVVANIKRLGDMDTDRFESAKDVIMNETYIKRARHVIYERSRTIRAVSALRVNNMKRFGELMNLSHASIRDDYEISCPQIDFLVEQAQQVDGVLGSRITGGGFGGSTVSLVRTEACETFRKSLYEAYRERYGLEAHFYSVTPEDGARELL